MPIKRISSATTYTSTRLAGLQASSKERRDRTVQQLQEALDKLHGEADMLVSERKPITLAAIARAGGPIWQTIKRNPEARQLWEDHKPQPPHSKLKKTKDPVLSYSRADLLAHYRAEHDRVANLTTRLTAEIEARTSVETRYHNALAQLLARDARIAALEAELAKYEQFLSNARTGRTKQEHEC